MERPVPAVILVLGLVAAGFASIGLGTWRDAWWPIASGVSVLALAAWIATEERAA